MEQVCQQRTEESVLSIVVDDFDSKLQQEHAERERENVCSIPRSSTESSGRAGAPDDSIRRILDEAEHRKDEFRKLLDEHNAVVQSLKKMEKPEDASGKLEASSSLPKTPIPT